MDEWIASSDVFVKEWTRVTRVKDPEMVLGAIANTPVHEGRLVTSQLLRLLGHRSPAVKDEACATLRRMIEGGDSSLDVPDDCDRRSWKALLAACPEAGCTPMQRIVTALRR